LEYVVDKGNVLYIPPYWWYSIQFSDDTSIYAITYNSLMNVVAYLPQWVLYFIQQQNIYKKVAKTKDVSPDGDNKPVSKSDIGGLDNEHENNATQNSSI